MDKMIRIACQGASAAPYDQLVDFQGKLKDLHRDDYERLKRNIIELGFSEPISVWVHDGQYFILNGHQRLATIRRMVDEGFSCPDVPISLVEAETLQEAKRKVLSLTSQFGRLTQAGLLEFIADADISREELVAHFRFPEIDLPAFIEEFLPLPVDQNDLGRDAAPPPAPPAEPPQTAGVKMVQLFFDEPTAEQFSALIEDLKPVLGTTNITDTVLAAVKAQHASHNRPE